MNNREENIFTLIAAFFCGEKLTLEEKEKLEQWKNASSRNQELYQYYQNLFERRDFLSRRDKIQVTADVYSRIFSGRDLKSGRKWNLLKLIAFIGLPLFLSVWFLSRQFSKPVLPIVEETQLRDVAPGKQKALLVLENGEVCSLSDSSMAIMSHKNIQVGQGGVLQYTGNNRSSEVEAVYHTLVVERSAEFQLVLPDGTKVWLNSGSELKYPDVFNEETRQVYLKGEAYFEVKHTDSQPFIVQARECEVRVLGTTFNISSYEEENAVVTTLVNGKVAYSVGQDQGELAPGEQCVYDRDKKTTKVRQVDVNQYISWKNGLFVFDHIRMEELAKQISRWYDVNVVFPDPVAREVSFTGAMERYQPVSYIIRLLNETNTVECALEEGVLVFRKK